MVLSNASSRIVKHTWFLDQQYRIPFDFLKRLGHQGDTLFNAEVRDTFDRNVTTVYIGHSSEWSRYSRNYTDQLTFKDNVAAAMFNNTFNYGLASADTLGAMKLDNKVFLRLQPWGSEGIVSKIEGGVGDELRHYFDSTSLRPTTHVENSVYLYAGAEGQFKRYMHWDAKAKLNVLGYKIGDTEIEANADFNFYPFRRARTSPITVAGHFSSTLLTPDYYLRVLNTNHYSWQNDFGKVSTTMLRGSIDIPRWRLNAEVGYALLANHTYYDTLGLAMQHSAPISVLSASVSKNFVVGPMHFDNRVLLQYSSNPDVLPLPALALNLRWYAQFPIQKDVMVMQVGANGYYNTKWFAPSWNPALGVFHNQNQNLYENGPFFDLFVNIQWKRLCLYVKYQNFGRGWPMEHKDYFTADRYIYTVDGMEGLKLGMFWPFYFTTEKHTTASASGGGGGGGGGPRSSRR